MAVVDQGALDRFDVQLTGSVKGLLEDDEILGNLARAVTQELLKSSYPYSDAFWQRLGEAVGEHRVASQVDQQPYAIDDFTTYTDRTSQHNEASLAVVTTKLDTLTATVAALVAHLGPPNVKP